jgi:cytidine deaminase
MEAITCCARNGVSARFGTLFTTTFPCHNCAKHIVAAGIRRVVFVEPYPKSMALDLHDDAIELESPEDQTERVFGPPSPFTMFEKVCFRPFVGVGARRYVDLFSKKLSTGKPIERKDQAGNAVGWTRHSGSPRVPLWPASHLEREKVAVQNWSASYLPSAPRRGEGRPQAKEPLAMSADKENKPQTYESMYRFAKEVAAEAARLPDWKRIDTGAAKESGAQANEVPACVESPR